MVCARKSLSHDQTIATCRRIISQHCWAQHVACVWPPCCVGHVGFCWFKFENGQIWANNTQQIATCRNVVAKRVQHVEWGLYVQNQRCLLNWISCFRVITYGQTNRSVPISKRWVEPQKNGRLFWYSYWLLITHHQSSCHRGCTADQCKTSLGSLEARCYNNSQWNSRENISLAVKP